MPRNKLVLHHELTNESTAQRSLLPVARGAGFDRVVMARLFLVDFAADYPAVNKIYAEYFKPGRYPARTTVGVTHLALGASVEIDLIVRL